MDLSTYSTLTGITVSAGSTALVTAQIARTKAMLETMLGFTLNPALDNTNFYNELGKSQRECGCPSDEDEDLNPPDAVIGSYRLFNYNDMDKYFHVDPFVKLNKAKLVFIRQGDAPNGVTLKTFSVSDLRVEFGRDSWSKYIEHCRDCLCICSCSDCVQLAVDANWLDVNNLPLDLQYVWTDMITWYANCKVDIKSESIDTHSYTKFDRSVPELLPQNIAILSRYAGPHGSITIQPTSGVPSNGHTGRYI